MAFKDQLREARQRLGQELSGWDAPARLALTADPFMCASVVKIALAHGHAPLASKAASTLLTFDAERLWKTLLRSCVENHGSEVLRLGPMVLAAKTDRLWRQRAGGDWRVVAHLIGQLANAPKSATLNHLARLSERMHISCSGHPEFPGDWGLSELEVGAIWRVFETRRAATRGGIGCNQLLNRMEFLSETVGWERLDLAAALWSSTRAPAALALMSESAYPPGEWNPYVHVGDRVEELLITSMTYETPLGRKALSLYLEGEVSVGRRMQTLAGSAARENAVRAVERFEERGWAGALGEASVICAVENCQAASGEEALNALRAKAAATRAMRHALLPPLTIQTGRPRPA